MYDEHGGMGTVRAMLAKVLDEAEFEVECLDDDRSSRQRVSASELREIYFRVEGQVLRRQAHVQVSEASMAPLLNELRSALKCFVDPETDKIGHAFPLAENVEAVYWQRTGSRTEEHITPLPIFARALVRAAAITGAESTGALLEDWARGTPLTMYVSTILNGLLLKAPIDSRCDISLAPLPLVTTELPRLPIGAGHRAEDYLGLTLMKLRRSARPALFLPCAYTGEPIVHAPPVDGIDLDLLCKALSLEANCHVSHSFIWLEYPDTASFFPGEPALSLEGDGRIRRIAWRQMHRPDSTSGTTMTPADNVVFQYLDGSALLRTFYNLMGADARLRVAVDRWRRSIKPNSTVEDRWIDLRIALELLYLPKGNSGELRFRLALNGAWHLSDDPGERRRTFKVLRNAYGMGSKAVHEGRVSSGSEKAIFEAQELCRKGIVKLLREGWPKDEEWNNLVLGNRNIQHQ